MRSARPTLLRQTLAERLAEETRAANGDASALRRPDAVPSVGLDAEPGECRPATEKFFSR